MSWANADDSYDFLFKIVVIGDCGVGKSCIIQRFKAGTFVERYANTIGVDFAMKELTVDKKKIKLQIWDTAGQERFRTITQSYYRSAHGVVIVYDITKRATFLNIQRWMDEVRRYTSSNVVVMLIGNKQDSECQREVEFAEAEAVACTVEEIFTALETSAKDDVNVNEIFQKLAQELKDQYSTAGSKGLVDSSPRTPTNERIRIDTNNVDRGKCCL